MKRIIGEKSWPAVVREEEKQEENNSNSNPERLLQEKAEN